MADLGKIKLKKFLKPLTKEQRTTFAAKCGTTLGNLNQIIYSTTPCGASLAIDIDRESGGAVRCDDLCPTADFQYLRKQEAEENLCKT
ncbi:helix-turn-helix domain-containing protein [Acinetobacter sp. Ac_5812]|uniref:helix-turn-helix domain-containing protein n=1 Tax=Acinetobacter sp. Ac_5812 TaxID=1848937 RepID=UPI00148FB99D|nr:helix-turn-helix domain-containing protein [Acinetobacter sp. Ac_5812]NNP68414.1 hypothetical protein [Acinetobacter sp. Ac_5812]